MIVDSLQIQRGNPFLKPYRSYRTELTYDIRKGKFSGDLWGAHEYRPDVVMDEKYLEGNKIIKSWDNQKNYHYLATRLSMRFGPIKVIFQISGSGGINHYISNGNAYTHRYTNWYFNASISATIKKVTLMTGINTNWNSFFGETLTGGENNHYIMARYKHNNLSIGASVYNPFTDNYKQVSENRSQYASSKRINYLSESSRFLTLQLTYNFSFGRKLNVNQRQLNNSDEESGIMNTGK